MERVLGFSKVEMLGSISSNHLFYALNTSLSLHDLPIQWTLGECFATHPRLFTRELNLCQDCFGLRFTSFRPSGLVSFSSPYSSSTYRSWCNLPRVQDLICHTPLQIYPHRHACPCLQRYKRGRFHLCVRVSACLMVIPQISLLSSTSFLATAMPRGDGLITWSPLIGPWVAWVDKC